MNTDRLLAERNRPRRPPDVLHQREGPLQPGAASLRVRRRACGRAGLISFLATRSVDKSGASSIASTSRLRATAASVAVFHGSARRSNAGAGLRKDVNQWQGASHRVACASAVSGPFTSGQMSFPAGLEIRRLSRPLPFGRSLSL